MNGNLGKWNVVCMFESDLVVVSKSKVLALLFYTDDCNANYFSTA